MNIVIKPELTRTYPSDERGNRQVVFFVLTDDAGKSYECSDDLPGDVDPQAYLDARIEDQLYFVRQAEYPEHPAFVNTSDKSALQQCEEWIAAGCQVESGKDQKGEPIMRAARKEEWKRKHPS